MIDEIVLDLTPFGARAALLADGRVRDFAFADEAPASVVDRVYLGRVRAVDRALDAAFVDLGAGGAGAALLTARDARPLVPDAAPGTPIDRLVAEGAAVVVQGSRDAADGKGPRVTADIRLPGVYLLYRPRGDGPDVSRRVRGAERAGLVERGRRLFPAGGDGGGFTLRTAAIGADDAALAAEADRLRARWCGIEERARGAAGPRRLDDGGDPVRRVLRDHVAPGLRRLRAGGMQATLRCRAFLGEAMPTLLDRVERLDGDAFELTGVAEELEAALGREVPLQSGGSLVVEPTAALTAIDVNAGGGGDARAANLAAADEVARQLRLRNVGGTVVVDFIDPPDAAARGMVERRLSRALAEDPAPVRAYPMSPLGLVQISRRRRGPSLAERLTDPCATCAGTGRVPSLRRRAEALLAELEGAAPGGPALRLRLAPDLHAYLTGPAAFALEAVQARTGRRPDIEPAPGLPPGAYGIRYGVS